MDPNTRQAKRTPVTLKIKFKSATLEEFIERYAVDADGSIVLEISRRRDFPRILSRFAEEAEGWVASTTVERTRRERVAVGLAMEFLAAAVDGAIQNYESGRALVEWACRLLAKGPPTEFERAVHLASLAILQGVGDYQTFGIDEAPGKRTGHVDHASARYPDEDRFKLARVVARYELRVITTERLEPHALMPGMWYRRGEEGAKRLAGTFDLLTALDNWVTNKAAPGTLTAQKLDPANGAVQFERPLCQYPKYPRYTGPTNDANAAKLASNYACS